MTQTCSGCGIQAVDGEDFVVADPKEFLPRSYCRNCNAREQRQFLEKHFIVQMGFGIIGSVLVLLFPENGFGYFLLNLFFFQISLILSIVPHELGHALTSRQLGFEVKEIIVGSGAPVFRCNMFGFPFQFRRFPAGGLTVSNSTGLKRLKLRRFLVVIAGPCVNGLLALAGYLLDGWLNNTNGKLGLVEVFILANIFVLLYNLVPFQTSSSYGVAASDGSQLLEFIFGPKWTKRIGELARRRFLAARIAISLPLVVLLITLLGTGIKFSNELELPMVQVLMYVGFYVWLAVLLLRVLYYVWKPDEEKITVGVDWDGAASASPFAPLLENYRAWIKREIETLSLPSAALSEIALLTRQKKTAEAAVALDKLLFQFPGSYLLQVFKAELNKELQKFAEAELAFRDVVEKSNPDSSTATILTVEALKCQMLAGEIKKTRQECETLMAADLTVLEKVFVLDCLVILQVRREINCLDDADRWSRQAVEMAPDLLTLAGTRGSILTDLQCYGEARALLEKVLEQSESYPDKGICCLFLALCSKGTGDEKSAKKWAKKAARIYPETWLLQRIENEQLT